MGKIGIGDRLNANSKKNIIFAKDYRKVRLDPRTLIPSEHNKYSQDNIEELADNMLLVGQLQEIIVGRVDGQDRIIVGHRRTAAAVLNIERGHDEFKLVDCKIKEMSESLFILPESSPIRASCLFFPLMRMIIRFAAMIGFMPIVSA